MSESIDKKFTQEQIEMTVKIYKKVMMKHINEHLKDTGFQFGLSEEPEVPKDD